MACCTSTIRAWSNATAVLMPPPRPSRSPRSSASGADRPGACR
ncbi:MAG: hypothetical protein AB7G37_03215 [Solirubrobacteraceae bacterium]